MAANKELSQQYASVLFGLLLASEFLPAGYNTLLVAAFIFLYFAGSGGRVPKSALVLMCPIIAILVIGMLSHTSGKPYEVLKDIWYVGKSILFLWTGCLLWSGIRDANYAFRPIILAGLVVAGVGLIKIALNPSVLLSSLQDIRGEVSAGSACVTLALAISFAILRGVIRVPNDMRRMALLAFPLCSLAIVLAFSRTQWVAVVIYLVVLFGFFSQLTLRSFLKRAGIIISAGVVVVSVALFSGSGEGGTFGAKILYSISEITIANYSDQRSINVNWRGYESFRTLLAYLQGTNWQWLVGQGWGKLVDLGMSIKLGANEHRYISVMHNGYMYLLLKTGIVGVLIYLSFLGYLFQRGRKALVLTNEPDTKVMANLLIASSLVLLVTTLVVAGIFNKAVTTPFIYVLGLGWAACFPGKRRQVLE